jgi:hypothetical protein
VGIVALAYLVDVYLPWTPVKIESTSLGTRDGTDTWPIPVSVLTGLMLVLWEARIAFSPRIRRWRHAAPAILAGVTGGIAIAGVMQAREIWLLHPDHSLAYGAWIAVPLGVLLLLGALWHLGAFIRSVPGEVTAASKE